MVLGMSTMGTSYTPGNTLDFLYSRSPIFDKKIKCITYKKITIAIILFLPFNIENLRATIVTHNLSNTSQIGV